MANKQIYELTTRTFDGDSLVPFDTENTDPSTQAEKPYLSSKTRGDSIADFIANEEQYSNDLTTEDKTLTGAINELLVYALNIADEYDPTSTYDVDDFCIYEGVLYKCTTAIAVAEAWTPAHWTSTLVVDNFGSGGASVTLGTSAPLDASGENGDLYVQYEALTYKVVEYFVKINNSWRKSPYSKVVALTQAQYDLITPDAQTLYIITDAQSSYQTKQDSNLQTTADTIVGAINELNSTLAIDSANSPNAVSVNGTYQIPANVLNHTFIIIACRRGGYGNSIMFKKEELLTFDNGFTFLGTGGGYYTLKCSNTGLLTVTNITNLSEPYILVTGLM